MVAKRSKRFGYMYTPASCSHRPDRSLNLAKELSSFPYHQPASGRKALVCRREAAMAEELVDSRTED